MIWWHGLLLLFGVLTVLLLAGLPAGIAFLGINVVGAVVFLGGEAGLMQAVRNGVASVTNFSLTPIPFFILMGEVLFHTGLAVRAIDGFDRAIRGVPARLSVVAIVAGTVFSAISGSTIATTALLGSLLLPEMLRRGYHPRMAMGPIMAIGGVDMLIPPSAIAVLLGSLASISISGLLIAGVVPGDELKMLELGWKQQWLDRRAQTNIAAYWGDWKNMKGRTLFVVTEDCGSFAHGGVAGATAANGCPNGPNGLPATTINSRNANVSGTSKLHGLEFEGSILLTENWDARATFTWASSKYDDFIFNFVKPIAGFTQMKGNQNARFPEFSGSLSTGYTAPLGNTDWKWFVNGDLNYVGKTYVDESNLAYCKSYTLGNVRVGGEKHGLRLEGYVKNVTDNDSWAACARWTDFDAAPSLGLLTFYQGIAVTPNMPRQYGIRASYKF